MIKIENTEVSGWEAAIRGMRNPMNSWEKSDSLFFDDHEYHDICGNSGPCSGQEEGFDLGLEDHALMLKLAKAGPVHAKYRRMINVTCDITAPLYWWKEFDTYKISTVANSCSTMHKIADKEFVWEDFSFEHCDQWTQDVVCGYIIDTLERFRKKYINAKNKEAWYTMIQLLPSSYNQLRTVQMNYEVLANIYQYRRDHKLDEWRELCAWIENLPFSKIVTLKEDNEMFDNNLEDIDYNSTVNNEKQVRDNEHSVNKIITENIHNNIDKIIKDFELNKNLSEKLKG